MLLTATIIETPIVRSAKLEMAIAPSESEIENDESLRKQKVAFCAQTFLQALASDLFGDNDKDSQVEWIREVCNGAILGINDKGTLHFSADVEEG